MTLIKSNVRLVSLALLLALIAGASPFTNALASGRNTKPSKKNQTEKQRSVDKNSRSRAGDKRTPVVKVAAASKTRNSSSIANNSSSRKRSKALERSSQLALSKRQRAAEQKRAEERLRAEAARVAAVARERQRDEELRDQVQLMIASDDLTGEDPEIRRAAVNALGNHAGTVVVMDPQTGRVYSIVNQQWALREGFKPCSTIKLVTGLAGLNENVIDSNATSTISDWNQVSLTQALAYSKNGYFQQVGQQVGFEKMLSYARRLGLGEKTGINARNEFQGRLPGAKSDSAILRMSSHGDHFEVTALQLATLVSAMGNGGNLLTPFIPRTRGEEVTFKTNVRRVVNIDREAWLNMVPGMVGAVNYGSGRRAHDPAQTVVGKTGTCVEQDRWVGLFTSYAPLANPRLAIVVIARGADAHNHFPAAVAGRIYRELNGRFGTPAGQQVAGTRNSYLRTSKEAFRGDNEEEKPAVSYSYEPNGTKKTQLTHPLANHSRATGTVKPVLMSIPQKVVKPGVSLKIPIPVSGDGQTRPRRVTSR
jgi:penicillin-binding protein 2